MSNKTLNYGLIKPLPDEFYDIETFNGNADLLDSKIKEIEDNVGIAKKPVDDPAKLFDGAYVRYSSSAGKWLFVKGGAGGGSDIDVVDPTITLGNNNVTLKWSYPADKTPIKAVRILQNTTNDKATSTKVIDITDLNINSYTITGLTNGTSYSFWICFIDENGFEITSANFENQIPAINKYKPKISDFIVTGLSGQLTSNFKIPNDPNFDHVVIRINTGKTPISMADGKLFYSGAGNDVPFNYSTNIFNGTTYYLRAFTVAKDGSFNEELNGQTLTVTPQGNTYTTVTTTLKAIGGNKKVELNWDAISDVNFDHVIILKSEVDFASSVIDSRAKLIYSGKDLTYLDTDVINGKTYYYRIFVFSKTGEFWDGESGKAIAKPSELMAYGLRFNSTNNTFERLGSAVGMSAQAISPSNLNPKNDFDNTKLWGNMKRVCLDDTGKVIAYHGDPLFPTAEKYFNSNNLTMKPEVFKNYNIFTQIPKFYYKEIYNGDSWELWVCEGQFDSNFKLHPAFHRKRDIYKFIQGFPSSTSTGTKFGNNNNTSSCMSELIAIDNTKDIIVEFSNSTTISIFFYDENYNTLSKNDYSVNAQSACVTFKPPTNAKYMVAGYERITLDKYMNSYFFDWTYLDDSDLKEVDYRYCASYMATGLSASSTTYSRMVGMPNPGSDSEMGSTEVKLQSVPYINSNSKVYDKMPLGCLSSEAAHSCAKNLGEGFTILDFYLHNAIQLLFMIEYGTCDVQKAIGNGMSNYNSTLVAHGVGYTEKYGNASYGEIGKDSAVSYRGIENLWGLYNQMITGIGFSIFANGMDIYTCANNNRWEGYYRIDIGTVGANEHLMKDSEKCKFIQVGVFSRMPTTSWGGTPIRTFDNGKTPSIENRGMLPDFGVGYTSTTGYADQTTFNYTSERTLAVGGSYKQGAQCGLFSYKTIGYRAELEFSTRLAY